jgi:GSH-dependent disulfide-bond oxidoreductase
VIDLHYWPTPNGFKITIALEELGLPYRIVPVNIGRGEQFEPSFLAISPNNRMPAIVDRDPPGGGPPISVFESGAILVYLAEKTGKLLPKHVRGRVEVLEWLAWQIAGLGPMTGQAGHFKSYSSEKIPYAINRYVDEVHRLVGVLDHRLEGREYVAGDYSIADIAIWPWLVAAKSHLPDFEKEFPRAQGYLDRIAARPAVQKGRDAGADLRKSPGLDEDAKKVLFGQRARPRT